MRVEITMSNETKTDRRNVCVVGGGLGGLAAAIRIQANGHEVTLLEKRHQLGGRAGVFTEKGYTFDTGPTIVTPPTVVHDVFEAAGKKLEDYVELERVLPKYRLYFPDGTTMDYGGYEDNIAEIQKMSPEDVDGYRKFLDKVKPIYELGFEKFGSMPFETIWSMAKMAPAGLRYKAYKSVYGFVSDYVDDERLRMALSFNPLFIGGNPFDATAIYTLITYIEEKHGVWWVKGGTHKLVDAMGQVFEELGGTIKLNSEVIAIPVDRSGAVEGVETSDGKYYDADIVVCNSDVAETYISLIDERQRSKNSDKRYRKADWSMSLFMVYFGVEKTYPDMTHHSIVFGPRYRGLIDDIFKNNVIPDDFSTYLHIPTRTDPELAPPGCETMYACTPVTNLDSNTDWETKKADFKNHILEHLDERVLPGLLDNLAVERVFTPQDFKDEFNSYKGTAFSLQPLLMQSGYFRPHNRSRDIKGLYLVGAGTHPGAGVPSVIMSADITTDLIQQDLAESKI
ncbi:MAG: phytoene desaturase [Candidatus Lokiarchaeota archaeon]|nr:phytoene desaturase [Candidatus Lokiarchaeota archaeon]